MERGDVDTVVSMLAEDATWSMPPLANWYRGHEAITGFLREWPLSGLVRWRHVPTRAAGQPAVGCYTWDDEQGCFTPFVLDVLTLKGPRIAAITAFIDDTIFGWFGLPDRIDP